MRRSNRSTAVAPSPGAPTSAQAPKPGTLTDRAVRRVVDTLSADDLVAVAGGEARLELHLIGPERPDPDQLGLYTGPIPVVSGAPHPEGHTPEPRQVPAPRARHTPATPLPVRDHGTDIDAMVARINQLSTPGAVDDYLRDPAFILPVLKQVARALGPTVLSTGRSKAEVRRDIVAGTVGFRSRSTAMSGGAWS